MRILKNEQIRSDDLYQIAMSLAVKLKAVDECDAHEGIFISADAPDVERSVYAAGTNMIKNREVSASRKDFMEAIRCALADAGAECPICSKHKDA
jgi:hypothetical protein